MGWVHGIIEDLTKQQTVVTDRGGVR